MANACGRIVNNLIMQQCGKAAASGTDARVWIANYEDVNIAGSTVTDGVVSNIVMKGDNKFYRLESKARSTEGAATFATGTYGGTFDHSVTLRAFTKDQEVKDFMNTLKDARVLIIVENIENGKDKTGAFNGGTKFEVYGWDSGLVLTEMPWSTTLSDTVTYTATLASDENSKEGQLPLSVFVAPASPTEPLKETEALLTSISKQD